MKIAIEGPGLSLVDFDKILKVLKQCNRCMDRQENQQRSRENNSQAKKGKQPQYNA